MSGPRTITRRYRFRAPAKRQKQEVAVTLFRKGWDTVQVADLMRVTEAEVYNLLARR